MEAVGEKRGNAHALVDTLAEPLAVVEAVCNSRGAAHALVNTVADTLPEEEAVGDT